MFLGFLVTKNRGKHHAVANTQVFALFRGSAHDPTQESDIRNVCIPWDAPPPNNMRQMDEGSGRGSTPRYIMLINSIDMCAVKIW